MSVPKLRFPEFRDAGEWEEKRLGDITEKISDGIHSTPIYNENGQYYFVNGNNLAEDKIVINESTKRVDEIEYLKYKNELSSQTILISINGTIGNLAFFNGEKVVLGKSACYINLKANENKYFVFNLLKISNIQKYFEKELTGSTIKNLSLASIKNAKAFFPILAEQQKIADCLSSISDRITLETQKLDTLKAHKKGLMQQLFPAEGETLPKLRFPEFHNSGEWEKLELRKLGEIVSGLTYSPEDVRETGLLVLRSSNIQNGKISLEDNVYVDPNIKGANLSKTNDILICVRNGSKSLIGKNALIPDGMPLCTHGAFMMIFRSQSAKFVFQLFQTSTYQRQVDGDLGATINSINGSNFIKYKFYVPNLQEQQKIADCLSSIDEAIAAQSQAIELLKLHKKGLMQQLFPSVEEVRR
jgi:type I restriction enzyme S subunit